MRLIAARRPEKRGDSGQRHECGKKVGGTMECEMAFGINETNNNSGVIGKEEEGKQIVMASKELIDAMECEVRTASEESSEGEIVSDEERRSTMKSTLSLSSEISEEERIRRQIRERNLKKHRMVRTKKGLKYEMDLTEEET